MPIKESVTIDDVIEVLNRALEEDQGAITELFLDCQVFCNNALANDNTIQTGRDKNGTQRVRVLGIINGLFGVDDDKYSTFYGPIGMKVNGEGDGEILAFERVDLEQVMLKQLQKQK